MKRKLLKTTGLLSCAMLICGSSIAQISFTNKNTVLHSSTGVAGSNANKRSGNSVTVVDMNNDGFDDVCHLMDNGEVRIEYQQANGSFVYQYIGTMGSSGAWAMCAGDVDKNGYKDVITGYGSSLKLMKIDASGMMGTVTTLPSSGFFVQNMNFMDVNGDGWIDIFACDDNSPAKIYVNNGSGGFPSVATSGVIDFNVYTGSTLQDDDSGNYGSVWTDFDNDGDVDLYISKCRQAASSGTDTRRRDVLFVNNGSNVYTEAAATYGLGSFDQDWTPSFGDIDNDGDFDLLLTKHNTSPNLYINNGTGHFTASNALTFGSMPMQSQFEDFDNDGFIDIIMTGDNDHRIYRNNGNGTFTNSATVNTALTVSGNNLLSFASGDLNHDGKIDIYGSYGSTYNNPSTSVDDIFWQNSGGGTNHFLTLNLTASVSNNDGLGARANIYGAWGVQTREVRAGESYGTRNSSQLHFGLGTATTIDSVVVVWPSGVHTVFVNPAADQFLNVLETNPCTLSGASISANGPLTICSTGAGVTLTAAAAGSGSGYTYLWTNGATTQAITTTTAGNYAVTVTESAQCHSTSTSLAVVVDPNETPAIVAAADTVFCAGDSVLLSSTAASAYVWSNGATSQTTYASQSGNYTVQTQGLCQQWNSNVISVNVHPAPAPVGTDVTLSAPSTTTVTATGNAVVWYAAATGGTALATGPNYTTPLISSNTTFYAEDSYSYGGGTANGGKIFHSGGSAFSGNTTNAYMIFTANQACTLNTVKVYTDSAGVRLFELRSSTGTVLQTASVNLPADTSVVTLNFNLTGGTSYQLGTNQAQNNTTFGYNGPRLRRTSGGLTYPFSIHTALDTLVTITSTSQGTGFYYYFYDWKIDQAPVVCTSPRTPVNVTINPVGLKNISNDNAIRVYPNPASDHITVSLQSPKSAEATLVIYDMLGKVIHNETYNTAINEKTISTQGLKGGVYEMSISVDGKIYHTRFVVQ